MKQIPRQEDREERISMEAIVDANGPEELAMGWYYYLGEKIIFPFKAECISEREISPLKKRENVKVLKMASEDECLKEMFVKIEWSEKKFAVPLSQIQGIALDSETQEAIEDWHYWVAQGYEF